jgi:hypothetical protein
MWASGNLKPLSHAQLEPRVCVFRTLPPRLEQLPGPPQPFSLGMVPFNSSLSEVGTGLDYWTIRDERPEICCSHAPFPPLVIEWEIRRGTRKTRVQWS